MLLRLEISRSGLNCCWSRSFLLIYLLQNFTMYLRNGVVLDMGIFLSVDGKLLLDEKYFFK